MSILKFLIPYITYLCIITFANAQVIVSEKKYTSLELNEDLDSLKSYLIAVHPNPFSVISKRKFEIELSKIKSDFTNGLTLREYYRRISHLVAAISDGHTAIKFPRMNRLLNDESTLFPYIAELSISAPHIIINDYIYDTLAQIPNGSEIISINNIDANKIIATIINNTSGESNAYRLKTASNLFLGLLLNTYFDFGNTFTVKYNYKNEYFIKSFPAIPFKDFKLALQNKKKKAASNTSSMAAYSLSIQKEIKTAIIDFRYCFDGIAFSKFLDSTFDILKNEKIETLIIDLRENGGGNSALGDTLFKRIAKRPFTQFGKTVIKYSKQQKHFNQKQCEEDTSYCSTYNYMKSKTSGTTEIFESKAVIHPYKTNFNGAIYLLTSLKTFSSASTLSQCFKHYHMGTIIGEETGGWLVTYGDKISINLPISELSLSISQKKFYTIGAKENDLHGIKPDIISKSVNALDIAISKIKNSK